MPAFVLTIPAHLRATPRLRFVAVLAAMVAVTAACVLTGLDWWWYGAFRDVPRTLLVPLIMLGGALPMVAPLALWGFGWGVSSRRAFSAALTRLGNVLAQAAVLGWAGSSFLKALTGRAHPDFRTVLTHDISRDFQFGWFRAGIFWGWPSSHTTVAFAMAAAVAALYPTRRVVGTLAMCYALAVGLAVSVSIHWLSDFLAGAMLGTLLGAAVGRGFRLRSATAAPAPTPAP